MSASATNANNTTETTPPISEAEDLKMFQAARRTGRRNALGDLSEQFAQVGHAMSSSEFDLVRKRLTKEIKLLTENPTPGIRVVEDFTDMRKIRIDIEGAPGTLYDGEKFQLLFKFSDQYPFDSPQVTFIGSNIPLHPHIYSNGHICLSILTDDWSPALSINAVCLSILSMLSSCKDKSRPPDNDWYVRTASNDPKKTRWWYHDDAV
ncbi:unnamed protein product [Rotaria sp. Silwood1]|nr:unnamed protein product [Rotaria sp. Silwood1]CAF3430535.1 unnamed protein product [Rotaria sp. Silwood1]